MDKTILIVEDDNRISNIISNYLQGDFGVIVADNGAKALIDFDNEHVDLVILDVMLPVLDGWEVCRNIRTKSDIPIIMLTAKSDELSGLKGFGLGVDDYVTKPFSPKILKAKVKALLRRSESTLEQKGSILEIDSNFIFNELSHKVLVDREELSLSPIEFSILSCLIRNKDIVLTRNTILDKVWGESYFGDMRVVDTNIKRLREKLGSKADFICTVRGLGYKFEVK